MGRISLVEVEARLNATKYSQILSENLFEQGDRLYGPGQLRFQQDNAPCLKAKTVMKMFSNRGIDVVAHPPNSPDMNPIESIWSIIKKRVEDLQPLNKEQLRKCIWDGWNSVTKKTIFSNINHMRTTVIPAVINCHRAYPDQD